MWLLRCSEWLLGDFLFAHVQRAHLQYALVSITDGVITVLKGDNSPKVILFITSFHDCKLKINKSVIATNGDF